MTARAGVCQPRRGSGVRRAASAQRGGTVVFTNGVFDLLHPGHVRYLQEARALGDALIVGDQFRSVRPGEQGPGPPDQPAGRACRGPAGAGRASMPW